MPCGPCLLGPVSRYPLSLLPLLQPDNCLGLIVAVLGLTSGGISEQKSRYSLLSHFPPLKPDRLSDRSEANGNSLSGLWGLSASEARGKELCALLSAHPLDFFFSGLIQGSQSLAVCMIGGGFLSPPLPFFTLISILTVYCSYPYSIVKVISPEQLLISKHSRKNKTKH